MTPDLLYSSGKTQSCCSYPCCSQAVLHVTSVNFGESQKLNSFWSVALCQGERSSYGIKSLQTRKLLKGQDKGIYLCLTMVPSESSVVKIAKSEQGCESEPCLAFISVAKSRVWITCFASIHSKLYFWWSQSNSPMKALASNFDAVTALPPTLVFSRRAG